MPLHRDFRQPLLSRENLPPPWNDCSAVFNPGALRIKGKDHLLLRVQDRGRRSLLFHATEQEDASFAVAGEPVRVGELEIPGEEIFHVYDPRITVFEDRILVCLALDTDRACRLAIATTKDFRALDFLPQSRGDDLRNGVLFPERIGGRIARLERPNLGGSGDEIRLAYSDDLLHWEPGPVIMRGRPRFWDERIGAGPPPLKTREGWLLVYHGIASHFASGDLYQAGVALLDLEDPSRLIARSAVNILEPRETWELTGQVPNVVFPSGLTVDCDEEGFADPEALLRIYYGAADTMIGRASTRVRDLIDMAREEA
ncbi:MAG: glycoside hydrolase family 130 protein [Candidatus Krumholzibacteria bacterium]|jgi:beta-1,4-mannooligosaccharide/beta-1,4-mannosyl-N-acetylglucosamine phosphorylase|nr:glycoside hydrolase family 130 protein [Candidatus Krumholzibacteria bacterium]MDP6669700.1 glycoside hydrolase family 130 protein [Candidatus Krumholzibacteria bacterium]